MSFWFVIINPASGNNFVKKKKKKVLAALQYLKQPYQINFTKYSGHEKILVEEGVNQGYQNFISIGGDGTLHHVVNGVMNQQVFDPLTITVGVIPVGTGNDWVRNNNIPKNISKSIQILNEYQRQSFDIGQIHHHNKITFFNNITGIGYDGYVVKQVAKYKFLGKLAYLFVALLGLFKYKNSQLRFTFNDQIVVTESLMAVFGIGEFCGNGMRMTVNPDPKDGLFDITLVQDISTLTLFMNVAKMYNGQLATLKAVNTYKSNAIKIEVITGQLPMIQADGELIGHGNFEVNMAASKMTFVVGNRG